MRGKCTHCDGRLVRAPGEELMLFQNELFHTLRLVRILRVDLGLDVPPNLVRRVCTFNEIKHFLHRGYPRAGVRQLEL